MKGLSVETTVGHTAGNLCTDEMLHRRTGSPFRTDTDVGNSGSRKVGVAKANLQSSNQS